MRTRYQRGRLWTVVQAVLSNGTWRLCSHYERTWWRSAT